MALIDLLEEVEVHIVREQDPHADVELPLPNQTRILNILLDHERLHLDWQTTEVLVAGAKDL